jgi:hypothetical protein
MAQIASYTGRSPTSIARDLDRWGEWGLEGLADGTAPGNPQRITEEVRGYMRGRRGLCSRSPLARLSRTTGSCPAGKRVSTRWLPIKPARDKYHVEVLAFIYTRSC